MCRNGWHVPDEGSLSDQGKDARSSLLRSVPPRFSGPPHTSYCMMLKSVAYFRSIVTTARKPSSRKVNVASRPVKLLINLPSNWPGAGAAA